MLEVVDNSISFHQMAVTELWHLMRMIECLDGFSPLNSHDPLQNDCENSLPFLLESFHKSFVFDSFLQAIERLGSLAERIVYHLFFINSTYSIH